MPPFELPIVRDPGYAALAASRYAEEPAQVLGLLEGLGLDPGERESIRLQALDWVRQIREAGCGAGGIEALLGEYPLEGPEGAALLGLAEALIRIPDARTRSALIRDRLRGGNWRRGQGSEVPLAMAGTWALAVAAAWIDWGEGAGSAPLAGLRRRLERGGGPAIRAALRASIGLLGERFVLGRTIEEALARSAKGEESRYRHSFDMLGEAARTAADAKRYLERYFEAIAAVSRAAAGRGPVEGFGVSIKLSALHPRLEPTQGRRVRAELLPSLIALARAARAGAIGLTLDAEESARLDLTLDLFAALCAEPSLAGWEGLGIAVQAYQPRALAAIRLLGDLAVRHGRRIMVRLVKGAYWDREIGWAQSRGLPGYPVFTRKDHTDLSYLACTRALFDRSARIYPQFATHNAHTAAAVLAMAGGRPFELQRLHGMGEALHGLILDRVPGVASRAYDPVGDHRDLLPYLVRRLLENGANGSFVHRLADPGVPAEEAVRDPVDRVLESGAGPSARIPLPRDLYLPDRVSAGGLDPSDPQAVSRLYAAMERALGEPWTAAPIVSGRAIGGRPRQVLDPSDRRRAVGEAVDAGPAAVEAALTAASAAAHGWERVPAGERADCLELAARLLEERLGHFVALCCREAGKTVADGIGEVREAADLCRYYAARAREGFSEPLDLPGPAGERNLLSLHGRGVFACIGPWNFPLAIFLGQTVAALVAGNAVVAKPAEQTPLIAAAAVRLLHDAGIPPDCLHLLPGDGPGVGGALTADPRVCGVAFTGSFDTARVINRSLAARDGPIVPLIAETGGQNALIADSSALPEQLVGDILESSFRSAGQRCSALRVLFVQEEIADSVLEMLAGAMAELTVGDPWSLETDLGPIIDAEALGRLETHCRRMELEGRLVYRTPLADSTRHGSFLAPQVFEIDRLERIGGEVFGPVLHVIRFRGGDLDRVVEAVGSTGFGLTFGVHSRIEGRVARLAARVKAGNCYANRSLIGALVGVQPFGGEGLSGTGPKAGGPGYLQRFALERHLCVDLAATGGDRRLLSAED